MIGTGRNSYVVARGTHRESSLETFGQRIEGPVSHLNPTRRPSVRGFLGSALRCGGYSVNIRECKQMRVSKLIREVAASTPRRWANQPW